MLVRPTAAMQEALDREAPEALQRWASQLPATVAGVLDHWGLTAEAPYEPGGACSWTAPAGDVVVKVSWRHPESEYEVLGLRVWDGGGAVRVLDELVLDDTRALLLERCRPGTWLASERAPEEQDVVLTGLLQRLWPAPADGFPTLTSMCDTWADEAEARAGGLDRGLLDEGLSLMRSLPRTADREALLCTDLHARNILAAEREPWLVIDPKPHRGDPHYDVTQHLFNNSDRLRSQPRQWIRRMAALADLDGARVRAWMLARLVCEGTRVPWYADVARRL